MGVFSRDDRKPLAPLHTDTIVPRLGGADTYASTYALIIGIGQYDESEGVFAPLPGAAEDACLVTRWLRARGVPSQNILLLINGLSMSSPAATGLDDVTQEEPTLENLRRAMVALPDRQAEHLFVYWAGHGAIRPSKTIPSQSQQEDEAEQDTANAKLSFDYLGYPADVKPTPISTSFQAINLGDLIAQFQLGAVTLPFLDEVVFLDVCATPDYSTRIEHISLQSHTANYPTTAYALAATSPGFEAYQDREGHGYFTNALLSVLTEEQIGSHWPPEWQTIGEKVRSRVEQLRPGQGPSLALRPLETEEKVILFRRTSPVAPLAGGIPYTERLFGRQALVEEGYRLIERGVSLAYVGVGGIGKTAVAADLVKRASAARLFPDGIVAATCSDTTSSLDVLKEFLHAFDREGRYATATRIEDLSAGAADLLRDKRALLVIDNGEYVADLRQVVQIVHDLDLTLLVTTRDPQPLPPHVCERREVPPLSDTAGRDLFYFIFSSSVASVALEEAEVLRIVRSLNGYPMSIQLIASYARDSGRDLAAIAKELDEDKKASEVSVEQQSASESQLLMMLNGVLARSMRSLSPQARKVFVALGTFRIGNIGRDAVYSLANYFDRTGGQGLITELISRSLVRDNPTNAIAEVNLRDRLLIHSEVLRFAREQLVRKQVLTRVEHAAVERRLLRYYGDYTEWQRERSLSSRDDALDLDEPLIVSLLDLASRRHDRWANVRICAGMDMYWRSRQRIERRQSYLLPAIRDAIQLAHRTANFPLWLGETVMTAFPGESVAWFRRRIEVLQTSRTPQGSPERAEETPTTPHAGSQNTPVLLRWLKTWINQYFDCRKYTLRMRSTDAWLLQVNGQLDDAETIYRDNLRVCRRVGQLTGVISSLASLGDCAQWKGRLQQATQYYEEALKIARDAQRSVQSGGLSRSENYWRNEPELLCNLGQIAFARRLRDAETQELLAQQLFEGALIKHRQCRNNWGTTTVLERLGRVAVFEGDLEKARDYYYATQQDELSDNLTRQPVALLLWSEILLAAGEFDEARRVCIACFSSHEATGLFYQMTDDLCLLGRIETARKDENGALAAYRRCIRIMKKKRCILGVQRILAEFGIAETLVSKGEKLGAARKYLANVVQCATQMEMQWLTTQASELQARIGVEF